MRTIALLALLISNAAQSDATLAVGIGKGAFGEPGTPFERAVSVGYEYTFPVGVFVRPEAGYFMDPAGGGHRSSHWAGAFVGVRARSKLGLEMHVGVGPAYLANPDSVLGGHFQFVPEVGVGLADENFFVGLVLKHLSSAGLYSPNKGRDFPSLQVRILAF